MRHSHGNFVSFGFLDGLKRCVHIMISAFLYRFPMRLAMQLALCNCSADMGRAFGRWDSPLPTSLKMIASIWIFQPALMRYSLADRQSGNYHKALSASYGRRRTEANTYISAESTGGSDTVRSAFWLALRILPVMEHVRDLKARNARLERGEGTSDNRRYLQYKYASAYLAAIIAANLSVAHFGAAAVYINAFLFIGLDLTARDKLHEVWRGDSLMPKMAALIAAGSILSWLLNKDAGQIALASFLAFAAAASVDALVFHRLRERSFLVRVNGSNIPAALVDSIVFPAVAFGGFMPLVMLGQFAAKLAGGFVWSLVLKK